MVLAEAAGGGVTLAAESGMLDAAIAEVQAMASSNTSTANSVRMAYALALLQGDRGIFK